MFFRRKGDTTSSRKKDKGTTRQAIPGLRVLEKIGTGGFGSVFKAQHVPTGRLVALKILSPRGALDPPTVERFVFEARLLCELDHPNLVKGFGFGKSKGLIHLVMEYVRGDSVLQLLDQWNGAIDAKVALRIVQQVAQALDHLHEKGIVHKDIKPGNILFTPKGGVKVCDLGLAAKVDPSVSSGAYAPTTVGTREYVSPEQAAGKVKLDARSDVYSLGASLYHMVTGDPPRNDPADPEVRRAHVLEGLARAQRASTGMDRAVTYFLLRMMDPDPKKRYATPRDLVTEIQHHLDGIRNFG